MTDSPTALKSGLTRARIAELCDELGFLGIVALVSHMAERTHGSIECSGPRLLVKIKAPPRTVKKATIKKAAAKTTPKAVS